MAETATQYFTRICKEAGKTDAETASLLALAQDPKIATQLDETIRRSTDDYQAMKGRYDASEKRSKQLTDEWYPTAQAEYQKAMAELAQARQQLASNGYSEPPAFDASKYLTVDQLEKMNQERDARYAGVIKQATRLASRHAAKYGEELDVDEVERIAVEKRMPLDQAYKEWIAPRELKATEDRHKKEIEAAKAEAIKDYASQHRMPVDPRPIEMAPIHRSGSKSQAPVDIDAELLAAWNGAAQ